MAKSDQYNFLKQYAQLKVTLQDYFREYGGWRAFSQSPYTHVAILLTALSSAIWLHDTWPDLVLLFIPPVLGFTLAGYALIFAFGDDSFKQVMSGRKAESTEEIGYISISATFLHFIVVQIIALMLAILGKAHVVGGLETRLLLIHCIQPLKDRLDIASHVLAFIGFLPAMLSITNSLAAALTINTIIGLYVLPNKRRIEKQNVSDPSNPSQP